MTQPFCLAQKSSVERSGAAQGLAEVLAVLGRSTVDALLPELLAACSSPMPFVREGNLTLFRFLPQAIPDMFQVPNTASLYTYSLLVSQVKVCCLSSCLSLVSKTFCSHPVQHCRLTGAWLQDHLGEVLPAILDGLADESEGVRDAALQAGRTAVELFAHNSLPLLLPAVETGIIHDNWRIRQSSVELLGDLLFKVSSSALPSSLPADCSLCTRRGRQCSTLYALVQVAGTSGKIQMDGESDEEGLSSEAHGAAIIEALGLERRNEVRSVLHTAHEMCLFSSGLSNPEFLSADQLALSCRLWPVCTWPGAMLHTQSGRLPCMCGRQLFQTPPGPWRRSFQPS